MGDIDTKTYADEPFFGKPLPSLSNVEWVQGDPAQLKTNGVVQVVYFFVTFYKGALVVNEELSVLQEKFPDVQFIAVSNDPEREKVEKLLTKIAAGTCCDEVTKQVFRLKVPFIGWDSGKVATKAFANLLNHSVLHVPQAFIVDAHGNVVWRQNLLQNYRFSDSNFAKQLALVKDGKAVEQPNGPKPKPTDAGEAAEAGMSDDMSLF